MQNTNLKRYRVLSVDFSLVSYRDVLDQILHWRRADECEFLTMTPPYTVLLCCQDYELSKGTAAAAMTLPDGVGIIWAARLLGYPHQGRVTGPTLMLRLCDWGRKEGLRHFFYGGSPGVADKLKDRLVEKYPGLEVVGTYSPPFRDLTPQEDAELIDIINSSKSDIVWVCLGSPKQEKWMQRMRDEICVSAMIGVGAAFDFHSGRVKWAPAWIRRFGLEWAFRLCLEPRRMWRRNVNSFVFLWHIFLQRLGVKSCKKCKGAKCFPTECDVLSNVQKSK